MSASIYDIPVRKITGADTSLAEFKGQVLLLVNVASKCGLTKQYEGLEKLYKHYHDQGLVVAGFPANDFAGQEPGTNEEIQTFCTTNFGVEFPLFDKIAVVGPHKLSLIHICQGFGNTVDFDLSLVIPDKGLSLADGAIDPWNRPKYRPWFTELRKQAPGLGVPLDVPWRELPEAAREIVLRGKGSFEGVFGFFAQMEKKKYKDVYKRQVKAWFPLNLPAAIGPSAIAATLLSRVVRTFTRSKTISI